MKLSEYLDVYYKFSEKTSDLARKAAFAGIALVWVFKTDGRTVAAVPQQLILPTAMFALALCFDLLQYTIATCIWGVFHWRHEKMLSSSSDDPDLEHSPWLPRGIMVFFVLKLLCVAVGYSAVVLFVLQQLAAVQK
jgi:hypothetical protein